MSNVPSLVTPGRTGTAHGSGPRSKHRFIRSSGSIPRYVLVGDDRRRWTGGRTIVMGRDGLERDPTHRQTGG